MFVWFVWDNMFDNELFDIDYYSWCLSFVENKEGFRKFVGIWKYIELLWDWGWGENESDQIGV